MTNSLDYLRDSIKQSIIEIEREIQRVRILSFVLSFACLGAASAQTSTVELDLDFESLDNDVQIVCNKNCKENPHLNRSISFDSLMTKPVGSARVSSQYGWRLHPVLQVNRLHAGTDFAVPIGTPVKAAQSGKVVFAGHRGGYGKLLVIQHDAVHSTVYGHLNEFGSGIKVGSMVQRGQVVAKSGNTGMSTGPHLHFEVRVNGLAVHPHTGKSLSNKVLVLNEDKIPASTNGVNVQRQKNGRIRTVIR